MYGYVLQDWITMSFPGAGVVLQNESDWLAFSSFQDIAFWVDVRSVTATTNVVIDLQTSPTKDDVLFRTISTCSVTASSASVTVVKSILSTNPAVPLSTWVRWSLTPSGITTITFRILASATRVAA